MKRLVIAPYREISSRLIEGLDIGPLLVVLCLGYCRYGELLDRGVSHPIPLLDWKISYPKEGPCPRVYESSGQRSAKQRAQKHEILAMTRRPRHDETAWFNKPVGELVSITLVEEWWNTSLLNKNLDGLFINDVAFQLYKAK